MGRSGPVEIKLKYLNEPGKRVAKIEETSSKVIAAIILSVIFVFIVISSFQSSKDFSGMLFEDYRLIIILIPLFFLLLSLGNSTRFVLSMSTNTVTLERKFFGWRYSNKEFGTSKNLELSLIPYTFFSLLKKEEEYYYMALGEQSQSTKNPLFVQQYIIKKTEAEKLASFLNLKVGVLGASENKQTENKANIPGMNMIVSDVSILAIVSLVLGIMAIFMFFIGAVLGLPALILGIMALNDIKKNKKKGKTLAIIGIIIGALSVIITIGIVILAINIDTLFYSL